MIRKARGRIVARRWEGSKLVGRHTIYFVFAQRQEPFRLRNGTSQTYTPAATV